MENEFIGILGKADWEDEVVEVFEKYKLPDNFEEGDGGYTRWTPSCHFAYMSFDRVCKTEEQKRRKAEGNYYINIISFLFSGRDSNDIVIENIDGLDVPFGFKRGDTYRDIIEKLGEPHFELKKLNKKAPALRKWWKLQKENGESYLAMFVFDNKTPNLILDKMNIATIDPFEEISSLLAPHAYNPLEDKDRNIEL